MESICNPEAVAGNHCTSLSSIFLYYPDKISIFATMEDLIRGKKAICSGPEKTNHSKLLLSQKDQPARLVFKLALEAIFIPVLELSILQPFDIV